MSRHTDEPQDRTEALQNANSKLLDIHDNIALETQDLPELVPDRVDKDFKDSMQQLNRTVSNLIEELNKSYNTEKMKHQSTDVSKVKNMASGLRPVLERIKNNIAQQQFKDRHKEGRIESLVETVEEAINDILFV